MNYTSPPRRAAYHWFCQSRSLTGYATVFFVFCCFLSMEFIAQLLYKSLRFSGCFYSFLFYYNIDGRLRHWFKIRRRRQEQEQVTRTSKNNRVNIKQNKNFARAHSFFVHLFTALHVYDVKMLDFIFYGGRKQATTKFSYSF